MDNNIIFLNNKDADFITLEFIFNIDYKINKTSYLENIQCILTNSTLKYNKPTILGKKAIDNYIKIIKFDYKESKGKKYVPENNNRNNIISENINN